MTMRWYTWSLLLTGLVATVGLLSFLVLLDYDRVQQQVEDEASYLYDSIYDRTRINEVLLQSFSTLTATQADNHQVLRRFATAMRSRYPHVARLQLQQQVTDDNRNTFEHAVRAFGYTHFSLHLPDPVDEANPTPATPEYFPFTFVEPFNADTWHLLGKDNSQSDAISSAFRNSIYYRRPVATLPFKLDDGRTAYTLYQAILPEHVTAPDPGIQIASLVITFDGLLPASFARDLYTSVTLLDANGAPLIQRGLLPQDSWLPTLSVIHKLNRFGQPLQVRLSRVLVWSDFNWMLMLGVLLISAAVQRLLLAYLEQKSRGQRERARVLSQLEEERTQLETRVIQRTQELNAQLQENQRLAHRVMDIQEQERRHLARELHDELGQSLTAIRTDASLLKQLHPNEASTVHQSAESIDAIARHIYAVTYDLMRYLRPTVLDDLGLVDALHECIANLKLNERGIELQTRFSGPLNEMSETYNITLYRLVQESLTNSIRHASARRIELQLHRIQGESEDYLELSIKDDGQGFSQPGETEGGFGVIGMRERVNALGGRFTITSAPARGTLIEVWVPLNESITAAEALTPATPYPEDGVGLLH